MHNEADQITLRQKLELARIAEARKDFANAAKLYGDAWTLVQRIGPGVEAEARQTAAGLKSTRLELARAAQRRGDYRDAQQQINDALRANPADPEVLAFAATNAKFIEAQRGRIPPPEVVSQLPAFRDEKVAAGTLVQGAKVLYEVGKLDEAEAKLKEALKIDPGNEAAGYYYRLVIQARSKQILEERAISSAQKIVEIEDAWNPPIKRELLPVPNPMVTNNLIYTSRGRQNIFSKLDRIRLDTVAYDSLPLSEVVRTLNDEIRRRDPERRGINFLIDPHQETIAATPVTTVPSFGTVQTV